MNEESEHKQKIDDFLLGRMTAKEAIAFQKQLQENPDLRKETALQEKIIQGIKAFNNEELKSRLKAIHKEVVKPPNKGLVIRLVYRYVAVAASLLLLGGIAFWLFQPASSSQDLFQAFYEPYNFSLSTRDTASPLLVEATILYQQGQYQEALIMLDSLAQDQPDSMEYQLAKGICYLEVGQLKQARQIFQQIIQSNNTLFKDQAYWYLALSWIKEKQPNEAKVILNIMLQNDSADQYQEAVRLLEALN